MPEQDACTCGHPHLHDSGCPAEPDFLKHSRASHAEFVALVDLVITQLHGGISGLSLLLTPALKAYNKAYQQVFKRNLYDWAEHGNGDLTVYEIRRSSYADADLTVGATFWEHLTKRGVTIPDRFIDALQREGFGA